MANLKQSFPQAWTWSFLQESYKGVTLAYSFKVLPLVKIPFSKINRAVRSMTMTDSSITYQLCDLGPVAIAASSLCACELEQACWPLGVIRVSNELVYTEHSAQDISTGFSAHWRYLNKTVQTSATKFITEPSVPDTSTCYVLYLTSTCYVPGPAPSILQLIIMTTLTGKCYYDSLVQPWRLRDRDINLLKVT